MNRPGSADSNQARNRLCWPWLVLVLIMACSTQAFAQVSAADEFSSREAVSGRLEAVKAELEVAEGLSDTQQKELLEQLEVSLYQHLEAIDNLEQMDRESHELKTALRDWQGFDNPPPYTILFVDELRSKRDSLEQQQKAAVLRHRIIADVDLVSDLRLIRLEQDCL